MARRAAKGDVTEAPDVVMVDASAAPDVQARLFFTEGSADLVKARKWIAQYSLPRATKRLRVTRRTYDRQDPFEVEVLKKNHSSREHP